MPFGIVGLERASVESEGTEGKPPIHVKFEIPCFTTSGIQVWLIISVGYNTENF